MQDPLDILDQALGAQPAVAEEPQLSPGILDELDKLLDASGVKPGKLLATSDEAERENLSLSQRAAGNVYNASRAFSEGALEVAAAPIEAAGQLTGIDTLRDVAGGIRALPSINEGPMLGSDGERLVDPGFGSEVAGGFGSAAGFIAMGRMMGGASQAAGNLGKFAGMSKLAGASNVALGTTMAGHAARIGAITEAQSMFRDAEAAGASKAQQFAAFFLGAPVGAVEGVGIGATGQLAKVGEIMAKIDARSGGALSKAVTAFPAVIREGAKEAGQEGFQTFSEKMIAQQIVKYADPEELNEIMGEVGKNALIGGIVGSGLASVMAADTRRLTSKSEQGEQAAQDSAASEILGEAANYTAEDSRVQASPEEAVARYAKSVGMESAPAFELLDPAQDFADQETVDKLPEHADLVTLLSTIQGAGRTVPPVALVEGGDSARPAAYVDGVVVIDKAQQGEAAAGLALHEILHGRIRAGSEAFTDLVRVAQAKFPSVAATAAEIYEAEFKAANEGRAPFAAIPEGPARQAMLQEEGFAWLGQNMPKLVDKLLADPDFIKPENVREVGGFFERVLEFLRNLFRKADRKIPNQKQRLKDIEELAGLVTGKALRTASPQELVEVGTALADVLRNVDQEVLAQPVPAQEWTFAAMPEVEQEVEVSEEDKALADAVDVEAIAKEVDGEQPGPKKAKRAKPAEQPKKAPEKEARPDIDPKLTPAQRKRLKQKQNRERKRQGKTESPGPPRTYRRDDAISAAENAIERFERGDERFAVSPTIEVDGQERPRMNSEGKPIAATDEALRAFYKWFGESKVVDEQGRPLVVYHGTPDGRWLDSDARFKTERERYGAGAGTGAFWFAASRATAATYADDRRAFDYQGAEPRVIAAYLSIENPLAVQGRGQKWRSAQRVGKTGTLIDDAIAGGHDGAAIYSVRDDYQTGVVSGDRPTDTFVAFVATQIKSADENRGTFDGTDPDIRFAAAYHGSPYDFDRFSLDKIGTGEGHQAYGYGLYFASRREVAQHYKDALGPGRGTAPMDIAFSILNADGINGDRAAAIEEAESRIRSSNIEGPSNLKEALKLLKGGVHIGGRGYTVNLAPSEDEYLLWDEPLSKQSEKVKAAVLGLGLEREGDGWFEASSRIRGEVRPVWRRATDTGIAEVAEVGGGRWVAIDGGREIGEFDYQIQATLAIAALHPDMGRTGEGIYREMLHQFDSPASYRQAPKLASRALLDAGIRGIKYLDGASRSEGAGAYNYVLFSDEDVEIVDRWAVSPEEGDVLLANLGKGLVGKGARAWQKNMTSRGLLPQSAFDAMIEIRDSRVAVANRRIKEVASDLRRALKESGELNRSQRLDLDRALKGLAPMSVLPEPLRPVVERMRAEIDEFSAAMISSGAVEGDLVGKITDNMGFYVTRSYQAFDDPDWSKKVPVEVRNRARAFLREQYKGQNLDEDRINALIEEILVNAKNSGSPYAMLAGGKLGKKDLSILKRRKVIAPEIRALLGEYKDPMVNYARSVSKMAFLVANHKFLATVRAKGLDEGYFSEEARGDNVVEIAAEADSMMAPLNGLYTSEDVLEAFESAMGGESLPEWLSHYMKVNGLVKMTKTVGSFQTHVRNVAGNTGFALAQGHFNAGAFKTAIPGFAASIGILKDKAWRSYFRDALAHGVVHESARAGELHDIIKDSMGKPPEEVFAKPGALGRVVKLSNGLTALYQAEDDVWKLYAWENEKARYAKAYPEWSEEKVKAHAAKIVRATYPTYSLVPSGIKQLRRLPFMGTFTSFPAEVVRVGWNTVHLIREELSDPRTRKIGAQRLVGSIAASLGPTIAALATAFYFGYDEEDRDAMREFAAPWDKNADWLYLGKDGKGNDRYVNLGYTDPWSYLKGPLHALMNGEDVGESVLGAMGEAAEPFFSEEILFGTLMNIRSNQTESGGTVYNEAEPAWAQGSDVAAYLWKKALQPGTVSSIQRIKKGVEGEVTPWGKAYNSADEAIAMIAGQRRQSLDLEQALNFKARDYATGITNANKILSSVASRTGVVDEDEIRSAWEGMEAARRKQFDDLLKSVRAARRLGLTDKVIKDRLRGSNISQDQTDALIKGVYEPYDVTGTFLNFYERGATAERKKEIRERRNLVKQIAKEAKGQ